MRYVACGLIAALIVLGISFSAAGSVVYIGGEGSTSTEYPEGPVGLLSGGETATAEVEYTVTCTVTGGVLTVAVTNTSPAIFGTDAVDVADAPVISDIMFRVPDCITGISLQAVNGVAATGSGWDFSFNLGNEPESGFGFLRGEFDAFVDGGPPGDPAPVIGSIYDPDFTDGPGNPTLLSPTEFAFALTFSDDCVPDGFSDTWFCDREGLGSPSWLSAAKFMSGANGGSATVTDPPNAPTVPAPAALVSLVGGLVPLGGSRLRRRA